MRADRAALDREPRTAVENAEVLQRRHDAQPQHAVVRVGASLVFECDDGFDFAARRNGRVSRAGQRVAARREGRLGADDDAAFQTPLALCSRRFPVERYRRRDDRSVRCRSEQDGVGTERHPRTGADGAEPETQFFATLWNRAAVDRRRAANEEQRVGEFDLGGHSRRGRAPGVEGAKREAHLLSGSQIRKRRGGKRGVRVAEIGGGRDGERCRLQFEARRLLRSNFGSRDDLRAAG